MEPIHAIIAIILGLIAFDENLEGNNGKAWSLWLLALCNLIFAVWSL